MLQRDACQILFTTYCDDNDNDDTKSLQYNFGLHAVVFYELVGVLWLLMRSTAAMVTFHQVLLFTSLLTLGLFYLGGLLLFPWTDYMSSRIVTCYSMACLLSMWTVFIHPTSLSGTVKWSIPANSIFYAAVRVCHWMGPPKKPFLHTHSLTYTFAAFIIYRSFNCSSPYEAYKLYSNPNTCFKSIRRWDITSCSYTQSYSCAFVISYKSRNCDSFVCINCWYTLYCCFSLRRPLCGVIICSTPVS